MMGLGKFPEPVKIGPRYVAWIAEDIDRWVSENNKNLSERGFYLEQQPIDNEVEMTPSTLPNKLWRAASEVKSFVEKFPDGVILTDVQSKVEAYKALNRKEQNTLLDFLRTRESILMFECRPLSAKYPTIMLRHKRFGYPKTISGHEYPLYPSPKIASNNQPPFNDTKPKEQVMAQEMKATPELLRKQAEELLKLQKKLKSTPMKTTYSTKNLLL